MTFLPDTDACIGFLRGRNRRLIAQWQAVKANEFALCSVVVSELRHGAERSANPAAEHAKLDAFLSPFVSLPFDDVCAVCCAKIRATLEGFGGPIIEALAGWAVKRKLRKMFEYRHEVTRRMCEAKT